MNPNKMSKMYKGNDIYNNTRNIYNPGHKGFYESGKDSISQNIDILNNPENFPPFVPLTSSDGGIQLKQAFLTENKDLTDESIIDAPHTPEERENFMVYGIRLRTGKFSVKTKGKFINI